MEETQTQYHDDKMPPSALEYQRKQVNGISMSRLAVKRESAVEAARMAGIVPFTVLNFNPVPLSVESGIVDITVPPVTASTGIDRQIPFGGGHKKAKQVVISNLRGYAYPTEARNEAGTDPNNPDVTYEWKVVLPIEQARLFEFQYNNSLDPSAIGGVLVFKGDGHNLNGKNKEGIIEIPVTRRLKNGTLAHYTQPVSFVEKLTEVLQRQKEYCMAQLRQAEDFSRKENLRDSIHNVHANWGQFAADQGWQNIERLAWLLPRDADSSCKKCGRMRSSGTAYFCECGHPYDPFAAFMAGMKVDLDVLAALPLEQIKEVRAEMAKRKALFADEPTK